MLHDMLSSQERKRVYKALLSKHVMTTLVYVTTQESFTNHFQASEIVVVILSAVSPP